MFLKRIRLKPHIFYQVVPAAGLKDYKIPERYDHVEFPERRKLPIMPKVPLIQAHERPIKMMKRLIDLRGPEPVHNKLIHKQYGLQALTPGNLRYGHFEMIRLTINRNIDEKKMFAIWRVDPPWKPITRKGQGHRMGGGKGSIDHYVTPVKANRIIVEIGGNVEFEIVRPLLEGLTKKLPFKSWAFNQEMLEEKQALEQVDDTFNQNPFDYEFLIKNNIQNCHRWIGKFDKMWYFRYK